MQKKETCTVSFFYIYYYRKNYCLFKKAKVNGFHSGLLMILKIVIYSSGAADRERFLSG